jgi:cytochrome c1
MAKTLQDVVNFYGTLFGDVPGNTQPPLTEQEKADLVAFLETL